MSEIDSLKIEFYGYASWLLVNGKTMLRKMLNL